MPSVAHFLPLNQVKRNAKVAQRTEQILLFDDHGYMGLQNRVSVARVFQNLNSRVIYKLSY